MLAKDRILAVDIGNHAIKLAEFAPGKGGTVELVNFAVEALGLASEDEHLRGQYITTTIQSILRERGIRPGPAVICVSGQNVFSRFVKLPPVDKDKIAQIVAYEAQQNVPFPIDEVVWDYQLIGSSEEELDVMLAAIKGDIVEVLTRAVASAGLSPELVDVAPMALYNAARFNQPETHDCTLVVDAGGRSTDLVFMEAGRVFIRSLPVAGNAITQQIAREFEVSFDQAEQMKIERAYVALGGVYKSKGDQTTEAIAKICRSVMTRMHAEINRSISFYRGQQGGSKPARLILTGGASMIPGTDRFFRDKLGVEVDYFNPFENVPIRDSVDTEEATANICRLGQVVGLALRNTLTCPIEINLMPDTIKAQKAFRQRQPLLIAAGAGVVLTLAVWWGFYRQMAGLAEQRFEKVNREAQALDGLQRQLSRIGQEITAIEGDVESLLDLGPRRAAWLDVLEELRRLLPDGMWIRRIERLPAPAQQARTDIAPGMTGMDEGPPPEVRLLISGMAWVDQVASDTAVIRFRDTLRASPLFSDNTQIRRQPPPGPVMREFDIELVLESSL